LQLLSLLLLSLLAVKKKKCQLLQLHQHQLLL
jgi:hypothetical protein